MGLVEVVTWRKPLTQGRSKVTKPLLVHLLAHQRAERAVEGGQRLGLVPEREADAPIPASGATLAKMPP